MFLLVTGASGAGKSTVRRLIAPDLEPEVACIELHDVVPIPPAPTLAWRQQATEAAVQRALALEAQGRHLLLCGDPVAPGEVIAAPSADRLEAVAACLLDVDRDAQTERLWARGDDPTLLERHLAFADWMRGHAGDPRHMRHVLRTGGWKAMRWERLDEPGWRVDLIDTSLRTPEQVAVELLAWCRSILRGPPPKEPR